MSKSPITCHVLNSMLGQPAQGITVKLGMFNHSDGTLIPLARSVTDEGGRCTSLLSQDQSLVPGVYKMLFETGSYFAKMNLPTFYPYVEIIFTLPETPDPHYHIPLLLSPYSYTTYRGS